jgi:hypothetical protein
MPYRACTLQLTSLPSLTKTWRQVYGSWNWMGRAQHVYHGRDAHDAGVYVMDGHLLLVSRSPSPLLVAGHIDAKATVVANDTLLERIEE